MGKQRKNKKMMKHQVPSDKELLQELATLDEVTAYVPTNKDHVDGKVPSWCELVLGVQRDRAGNAPAFVGMELYLRRHDGEMIIEVLDEVLHPNRGGGAVDTIWAALDDSIEAIMGRVNKNKSPHDEDKGMASGLTRALALLVTPFEPDEDAIKDIAMDRYAIRHGLQ